MIITSNLLTYRSVLIYLCNTENYFWIDNDTGILIFSLNEDNKINICMTWLVLGFNVETIDYKNIALTCWDVGGRDKMVCHAYFVN